MDSTGPHTMGLRADGVEREYDRVYNDGRAFASDPLGLRSDQWEAQDDPVDPLRYKGHEPVPGAAWLGDGTTRGAEIATTARARELAGFRPVTKAPYKDTIDKAEQMASLLHSVHQLDGTKPSLFNYRYKFDLTRPLPIVSNGEIDVTMNVVEVYLHLFAVLSRQPIVSEVAAEFHARKPDTHPLSSTTRLPKYKTRVGGQLAGFDVTRRSVSVKGLKPTPFQELQRLPMFPDAWDEGEADILDDPERLMSLVANHFSFLSRFWKRLLSDIRNGQLDVHLPIADELRADIEANISPQPERSEYVDVVLKALGFHSRASKENRLGLVRVSGAESYAEDSQRLRELEETRQRLARGRPGTADADAYRVPIGREETDPRKGMLWGGKYPGGLHAPFPPPFRGGRGLAAVAESGAAERDADDEDGTTTLLARYGLPRRRKFKTDWREYARVKARDAGGSGLAAKRESLFDEAKEAALQDGQRPGVITEAKILEARQVVQDDLDAREATRRSHKFGYRPMHNSLALAHSEEVNRRTMKCWPGSAVEIIKTFSPIDGDIACSLGSCPRRFDTVHEMKAHVVDAHPELGRAGRANVQHCRTRKYYSSYELDMEAKRVAEEEARLEAARREALRVEHRRVKAAKLKASGSMRGGLAAIASSASLGKPPVSSAKGGKPRSRARTRSRSSSKRGSAKGRSKGDAAAHGGAGGSA